MMAKNAGVAIGAHPSLLDRENFGRTEVKGISRQQVYELVTAQLKIIRKIVGECNAHLHHVKPHGALYNMAATEADLSMAISQAVYDFDTSLVLFGLSGSYVITEAKARGIKTASEVFADRTYQDDGSLTPRTKPNALIEDEEQSIRQVIQMIKEGTITSITGRKVPIAAETICLHGDGKNAVAFARAINMKLKAENIDIKAI
jgi:UPF0271 protein